MRNALYFLFDRLDFYDTIFLLDWMWLFRCGSEGYGTRDCNANVSAQQRSCRKIAQLLSVADKTQSGTEEKQGAIHDTVRDMTHLLKLQSLGTQIGSRLEGLSHKTGQSSWFTMV